MSQSFLISHALSSWIPAGILMLTALLPVSVRAGDDDLRATGGTRLPYALYLEALNEYPEYDPDMDYTKLGTIVTKITPGSMVLVKKNLVDRVVVQKSAYKIFLYKGQSLVKSFNISLGKNPRGPKMFEGDKKTPEGKYVLDYVKLNSSFYKAFHISYPSPEDIERAKKAGRRPGGMIMIHGEPPYRGKSEDRVDGLMPSNWTNGCIALINSDMDEFLDLVDPGTTIEIFP